ncbi:MAG: methylated-DNA--[protein]-cysteine S-methyltransferase [Acetobacteraceae bacterium]
MNLFLERVRSPIGTILLVSDADALRALEFADHEDRLHTALRRYCGGSALVAGRAPADAARRIQSYFDGDLSALDAIPVRMDGTAFQRRVWAALRSIRPGTTVSYSKLAASIGAPTSIRAVGAANGANPVSIVVPCHRVIGAGGSLTGYGGGLPRKAWLIRHEARASTAGSSFSPHHG